MLLGIPAMRMDVPHLVMVEPAIFSKIGLIKVDTVREEVVVDRNLAIMEADVVVEIQVTEVGADVVVETQATEVEVEEDVAVTKIAEAKVMMALD